MRKTLFIFCLFFTIQSYGQTKISFDAVYSFDRGFRSLSSETDSIVILKNENESKKPGNRFGFNFNFSPNNKFSFKTGFRWVTTGYDSTNENENFTFKFFEIPLALRYYYGERKLRLFSEIGVGFHYLRSDDAGIKKWQTVALVGMGMEYAYSLELSFFALPSFRYHLTTNQNYNNSEENLFNSGVELGFRVKF